MVEFKKGKRLNGDVGQVKTENTLARNLDFAADKTSYDAACKRLLANKEILAWIMKSCIEEYRECSVKDIAEYYIEGEPQIAHTAVNADATVREWFRYDSGNEYRRCQTGRRKIMT